MSTTSHVPRPNGISKVEKSHVSFSLSSKALCIIAVPFAVQLLLIMQYGLLVDKVEKLASQEYYSKAVLNHGNWTSILLSVAANSLSAFAVSGDKDYEVIFNDCLSLLPTSYKETAELIDTTSPQFSSLKTFEAASVESEQLLRSLIVLAQEKKYKEVLIKLSDLSAKDSWLKFYKARHNLLSYYRKATLNDPEALPAARQNQKVLFAVMFFTDIAAMIFLIYTFNNWIGKKLSILALNAARLGARKELPVVLSGSDEIAYLDRALHQASVELQAAQKKLEESELRLKSVIRHMPVGLITLGENGTFETANDEIQNLLGVNEGDLLGKPLTQILPNVKGQNLFSTQNQIQEIEISRDEDSPLILELSQRSYPTTQGNLLLLALHDVTARRELEKMRQDFLNMVSHDLRSPLTSIRLFLNLLSRGAYGEVNESGIENLLRAERNVDRLLNMINDLLDFEKMQAGHISLDIESLSVEQLVASAADLMQGIAEKSGITFELIHTRSYLLGDSERLVQVMVNLMSNAVKFSHPGGIVTIESLDIDDCIEVRVTDRGRGVPQEKIDLIFDKFKQVDVSDSKVKKGIGLGLPICKWIIEQHGGSIGVRSTIDVGSTFWFRLQRVQD